MKKFLPLVALLAVTMFLASCDKDKDSKPASSFTYDSKTYTLTNGYIGANYDDQGVYEKWVTFAQYNLRKSNQWD